MLNGCGEELGAGDPQLAAKAGGVETEKVMGSLGRLVSLVRAQDWDEAMDARVHARELAKFGR